MSNAVLLKWSAQGEMKNGKFMIERSGDGTSWQTIGTTEAAQNSGLVQNHSFTDKQPVAGINLYRLKFIDLSGAYKYSERKKIEITKAMSLSVYPNPAKIGNPLKVTLKDFAKGQYHINILSVSGQVVYKGNIIATNEITFNFYLDNANFPEGNYIINVGDDTVSKSARLRFL